MARLDVLIENCADGRVIAHVPDFWGCHVIAGNRQQALDLLDLVIRDYLEWRTDAGHPVSLGRGKRKLIVIEECHVEAEEDVPGDTPIFDWDRQSLSGSDLHEALEVCAARMRQLEALAIDLHPRVLAWESRDLGHSVGAVMEMLESWLTIHLSQLGLCTFNPEATDPVGRMTATFTDLVRILRALDGRGRDREYTIPGNCGQCGGSWTVRKLLRRMAETEIESIRSVRQIIRAYQAG